MKRITQGFFIAAFLLFAASGVFAQEAVIRELAGTVEIKMTPSSNWEKAVRGQSLPGQTVISTGFRSTAVIAVGGTLITVRPLTRLTLTELSRAGRDDRISLNLGAGRIRADVKAQTGGRTDFTVRSVLATASVRGTVFEFDTLNLSVDDGTVEFSGAAGAPVLVDAGAASFADERTGQAASVEETLMAELRPELPIASEITRPAADKLAENTVEVVINLNF